jgi:hypothetical protein
MASDKFSSENSTYSMLLREVVMKDEISINAKAIAFGSDEQVYQRTDQ